MRRGIGGRKVYVAVGCLLVLRRRMREDRGWRSGMKRLTSTLCLLAVLASCPARAAEPANFLFLDADDMSEHRELMARPDIAGGQIIYSWR